MLNDKINFVLESSVNNGKRMCYHNVVIRSNTPEECVGSRNLLTNGIGTRTEICCIILLFEERCFHN